MQIKESIISTIIILTFTFIILAQVQATSSEKTLDKIINTAPISKQFQNLKNTSSGAKVGEALTKITDRFYNRKEAIKIGWQEEKQEFKGGFRQIVSDVWQKIKNLASSLSGSEERRLKREEGD